jgi:hypothetical protein
LCEDFRFFSGGDRPFWFGFPPMYVVDCFVVVFIALFLVFVGPVNAVNAVDLPPPLPVAIFG